MDVPGTYLCDAANVLFTVFGRESKVFVQTESHVVAVESVCRNALLEEVLLKSSRNGRLSRRRETCEPDSRTLLAAQLAALFPGEASMPCNVASKPIRPALVWMP